LFHARRCLFPPRHFGTHWFTRAAHFCFHPFCVENRQGRHLACHTTAPTRTHTTHTPHTTHTRTPPGLHTHGFDTHCTSHTACLPPHHPTHHARWRRTGSRLRCGTVLPNAPFSRAAATCGAAAALRAARLTVTLTRQQRQHLPLPPPRAALYAFCRACRAGNAAATVPRATPYYTAPAAATSMPRRAAFAATAPRCRCLYRRAISRCPRRLPCASRTRRARAAFHRCLSLPRALRADTFFTATTTRLSTTYLSRCRRNRRRAAATAAVCTRAAAPGMRDIRGTVFVP